MKLIKTKKFKTVQIRQAIIFERAPVNNFHLGVHDLLMLENLAEWGSSPGKQDLRGTGPKGNLEFKYFSSPINISTFQYLDEKQVFSFSFTLSFI